MRACVIVFVRSSMRYGREGGPGEGGLGGREGEGKEGTEGKGEREGARWRWSMHARVHGLVCFAALIKENVLMRNETVVFMSKLVCSGVSHLVTLIRTRTRMHTRLRAPACAPTHAPTHARTHARTNARTNTTRNARAHTQNTHTQSSRVKNLTTARTRLSWPGPSPTRPAALPSDPCPRRTVPWPCCC